jgi:tartrate-resistant acid phosphatase type 5
MAAPITLLVVVVPLVVAAAAELPRLEHLPSKEDRSLALLAVGDWGRRGQFNQSLVAEQVRILRARSGIVPPRSC